MKKVIISILHYNSNSDTIACLNSLLKGNYDNIDVEVYVLDNASKEELQITEKDYSRIGLTVLKSSENKGFTGGHNLIFESIKNKKYDYLLLLNNDSFVDQNFLQELIEGAKDVSVGAVVPKIYFTKGREFHREKYSKDETGKVIWYAGGAMDWAHVMSRHIGVDEVDHGQFDHDSEIDFATGACLLLKKEVLDKIGLFDSRYFLYYEDADLSFRIRKSGYSIKYVYQSIVWHNNAGSSGAGSDLHDYFLTRNRLLFGLKFAPMRVRIALLRESVRLIRSGRTWQKRGIRDYFLRNFGRGSYGK